MAAPRDGRGIVPRERGRVVVVLRDIVARAAPSHPPRETGIPAMRGKYLGYNLLNEASIPSARTGSRDEARGKGVVTPPPPRRGSGIARRLHVFAVFFLFTTLWFCLRGVGTENRGISHTGAREWERNGVVWRLGVERGEACINLLCTYRGGLRPPAWACLLGGC